MRLDDLSAMDSPGGLGRIRLETLVADITGAEDHRLVIDGPEDLVRGALAESEIDIRIDPDGTRRDWYERYEPVRQQELDRLQQLATLDRPLGLLAPAPRPSDPGSSILISLHRIRGHGSVYVIGLPMVISAGQSFSMILPFVCSCMGVAFPAAVPAGGDISLSLAINFSGTPIATSATPGSATEIVTFSVVPCWPWMNFIPFFTVTAVTSSIAVCEFSGATFFP
jgi:hypothetical protein